MPTLHDVRRLDQKDLAPPGHEREALDGGHVVVRASLATIARAASRTRSDTGAAPRSSRDSASSSAARMPPREGPFAPGSPDVGPHAGEHRVAARLRVERLHEGVEVPGGEQGVGRIAVVAGLDHEEHARRLPHEHVVAQHAQRERPAGVVLQAQRDRPLARRRLARDVDEQIVRAPDARERPLELRLELGRRGHQHDAVPSPRQGCAERSHGLGCGEDAPLGRHDEARRRDDDGVAHRRGA